MSNKAEEPVKRKPGRPPGSMNRYSQKAIIEAKKQGDLPHEFLLRIARGEPIKHGTLDKDTGEISYGIVMPSLDERIDCAKAAAPYYAAKLATVEVTQTVDDSELDELIRQLAAETGIGNPAAGESTQTESNSIATRRKRLGTAIASAFAGDGEDE